MEARKFIIRIGQFALLVVLIFLLPSAYFTIMLNRAHFYELPGKETIFIGDSRIETSLNDQLSGSTFNVAQSAESYMYSYIKLRKLLPLNPQVKRVVIGFSDLNLHEEMEGWYFKNQPLQFKISNFLFLMRPAEVSLLLRNNLSTTIVGIIDYPKFKFDVFKNMKPGDKINTLGVGRFEPLFKTMTRLPKPGEAAAKMDHNTFRYSKHQLLFLEKIVELCRNYGVELVFVSVPLHMSYQTGSRHSKSLHAKEYATVRYLDFTAWPMADSCFGDYEHLNKTGADLFTKTILDTLQLK